MGEKLDKAVKKRMSRLTLKFNNVEDEEHFQISIETHMRVPILFTVIACIGVCMHFGYRIYAVYVVCTSKRMVTGSLNQEVGCLAWLCVSLFAEVALRVAKRAQFLHGLFLYTSLPLTVIFIAFQVETLPQFDAA